MRDEEQWRPVYQQVSAYRERTGCTCDLAWYQEYVREGTVDDRWQEEKAQTHVQGEEKVCCQMNWMLKKNENFEDHYKDIVDAGDISKQRRKEGTRVVAL